MSYLEWDEVEEDLLEDAMEYSIVHRKLMKGKCVEYTVMAPDNKTYKVLLENVTEEQLDPLKGEHTCSFLLDEGKRKITALIINKKCIMKR